MQEVGTNGEKLLRESIVASDLARRQVDDRAKVVAIFDRWSSHSFQTFA
jgi:hypothetical protein